jgi:DNA-binding winged helix-turn-helix (wHTH) protein
LLRYLVENPDRLVTKDELFRAIWPHVVRRSLDLCGRARKSYRGT